MCVSFFVRFKVEKLGQILLMVKICAFFFRVDVENDALSLKTIRLKRNAFLLFFQVSGRENSCGGIEE